MYHVRILEAAAHELARLDRQMSRRIAHRIRWLAANLEDIQLEALGGGLAGFYKLRIGDYAIFRTKDRL